MRRPTQFVFASWLAGLAACTSPESGTYAPDEIERLCIAEGRGPTEPCAVTETGELGEGLRYALYDLRGADVPTRATDTPDPTGQFARNAAAIFEETEQRRWRP